MEQRFNGSRTAWAILSILVFCLSHSLIADAATITVRNGEDLNRKINNAKPGDTILVNPGTYSRLVISNKNNRADRPIVIKRNGNSGVVRVRRGAYRDKALTLRESSYMVFENIRFEHADEGVHVFGSHHIIFKNCEITNTGVAGFKVSASWGNENRVSHHVDWIGGKIWRTGRRDQRYGEAMYIGQAQQAYDETHDIWIEGVEIWDTNGGEAVNIKSEVYNAVVKDSHIHDIDIHSINGDHVNDSAFQIEAGNSGKENSKRHGNIWIVNNTIERVRSNTNDSKRANGIQFFNNPGVYIKGNTIRDVEGWGIRAFWSAKRYLNIIANDNVIRNARKGARNISGDVNVAYRNPGNISGVSRQTWYRGSQPAPTPSPSTYPRVVKSSGQQAENPASDLLDGSTRDDDRWSSKGFPQYVVVDYGRQRTFTGADLWSFKKRAYAYMVEISDRRDSGYQMVVDRLGNLDTRQPISDKFSPTRGRYVKLTVTGAFDYDGEWVSILEFRMRESEGQAPSDNLRGTLRGTQPGLYYLSSKMYGKNMYATGANGNARIGPSFSQNAQWRLVDSDGDGYFAVYNKRYSDSRLRASGGGEYKNVDVRTGSSGAEKTWTLVDEDNDGFYELVNRRYGTRADADNNDNIDTNLTDLGDDTLWQIIPVGN